MKGQEFDALAKVIIEVAENKKFYIWGAGYFGDAIYASLRDEIEIIGYIDSDEKKWNTNKNDLEIHPPSVLSNMCDDAISGISVLVSAGWTREIYSSLNAANFSLNENYFHIDEFYAIFMMYSRNKLCLTNLSVTVTERCTLRCEKCLGFMPHMTNPKHFTLQDIETELTTLFNTVDYVSSLAINGGDAMCNPECYEIIEVIGEQYLTDKIGTIELYTNAIIIPNERFLEMLKRHNVYFRFTDYGSQARQRIEEILPLLSKWGIRYDHVKFAQWCDMGYPQESNGLYGDEAWQKHFTTCDRRSCQTIEGGKFYYCGQVIGADKVGYCLIEESDYFDMTAASINKKELLEFTLGYSEKGYLSYCKKCNGGFNTNKKMVVAGMQLRGVLNNVSIQ